MKERQKERKEKLNKERNIERRKTTKQEERQETIIFDNKKQIKQTNGEKTERGSNIEI